MFGKYLYLIISNSAAKSIAVISAVAVVQTSAISYIKDKNDSKIESVKSKISSEYQTIQDIQENHNVEPIISLTNDGKISVRKEASTLSNKQMASIFATNKILTPKAITRKIASVVPQTPKTLSKSVTVPALTKDYYEELVESESAAEQAEPEFIIEEDKPASTEEVAIDNTSEAVETKSEPETESTNNNVFAPFFAGGPVTADSAGTNFKSDSNTQEQSSPVSITDTYTKVESSASSATLDKLFEADSDKLYLAIVSFEDNNNSVLSVSGHGLTFTKLVDQCSNNSSLDQEVWYSTDQISDSTPITATIDGVGVQVKLVVHEVSNADTSDPFGAISTSNPLGNDADATCGLPAINSKFMNYTLTTEHEDSMVLVTTSFNKNKTHTSSLDELLQLNDIDLNNAQNVFTTTVLDDYSIDGETGNATNWSSIAIEIKQLP